MKFPLNCGDILRVYSFNPQVMRILVTIKVKLLDGFKT